MAGDKIEMLGISTPCDPAAAGDSGLGIRNVTLEVEGCGIINNASLPVATVPVESLPLVNP